MDLDARSTLSAVTFESLFSASRTVRDARQSLDADLQNPLFQKSRWKSLRKFGRNARFVGPKTTLDSGEFRWKINLFYRLTPCRRFSGFLPTSLDVTAARLGETVGLSSMPFGYLGICYSQSSCAVLVRYVESSMPFGYLGICYFRIQAKLDGVVGAVFNAFRLFGYLLQGK